MSSELTNIILIEKLMIIFNDVNKQKIPSFTKKFTTDFSGLNVNHINNSQIKSAFNCLLNDINNNILNIDNLSIIDKTIHPGYHFREYTTFDISKVGNFTFLSSCDSIPQFKILDIDIFLENTYKLLKNLYDSPLNNYQKYSPSETYKKESIGHFGLQSLKLMVMDIIISLYFFKKTLVPVINESPLFRNINGIMNLFNVKDLAIDRDGTITIFNYLHNLYNGKKEDYDYIKNAFKQNDTSNLDLIFNIFYQTYEIFYLYILKKDEDISLEYKKLCNDMLPQQLSKLIELIYRNYNFNTIYSNAIRAIRGNEIIQINYKYNRGDFYNPELIYDEFRNLDFQNSIIKALIEDGIIDDNGAKVRDILKTIPETNTLSGGKKKASIKKQTSERILINGKKRIIYIGTRGGKYIKQSGKFISVKKLT